MANPHERVIKAALKTNADIHKLFGKIGTREHPRGAIINAYRQARKAIPGALDNQATLLAIFNELRQQTGIEVRAILRAAQDIGATQAGKEIAAWDLPDPLGVLTRLQEIENAVASVESVVDDQARSVLALAATGRLEEEQAIGDGTRLGIVTPTPATRETSTWVTVVVFSAWLSVITQSLRQAHKEDEFQRQLIANTGDDRTTETCLRAHGQVVGLDEKFTLTGQPRYANKMFGVPFHDYCRSSVVLVHREFTDDDLTVSMRDAAKARLKARDDDK